MEEKLREAFASLGNSIASAIPKVCVGILLVTLGLVVAKLVEVALRAVLIRLRFDSLIEKARVTKPLQRIGLRQQLSLFIPKLAYFLVIFLLAKTASDAFGLVAISDAIGSCRASAFDPGHYSWPVCRADGNAGRRKRRKSILLGRWGN
jgi:hypothetical protein